MNYNLERFLTAQQQYYRIALQEIVSGQKRSHWMWFIFPQIAGLGYSETARYYAIGSLDEAKAFMEDATLGGNLIEISEALLKAECDDAAAVMGRPDDLKLRSSMTLFALAKPECEVFQKVLDKFFRGERDQRTIEILGGQCREEERVIQPGKSRRAYLTEKGKEYAGEPLEKYQFPDRDICERFEFRNIRAEEAEQAAAIEKVCFPPNEACSEEMMLTRIAKAPELFLVAVDKQTGKIAGFLNGLSTDESSFRDEFFTDADLYDPDGRNVMLLGLDVLPDYRRQGLARELTYRYLRREREKGRRMVLLTCLPSKINMYKKLGFRDDGIADSSWGGEQWHEMSCVINL